MDGQVPLGGPEHQHLHSLEWTVWEAQEPTLPPPAPTPTFCLAPEVWPCFLKGHSAAFLAAGSLHRPLPPLCSQVSAQGIRLSASP